MDEATEEVNGLGEAKGPKGSRTGDRGEVEEEGEVKVVEEWEEEVVEEREEKWKRMGRRK